MAKKTKKGNRNEKPTKSLVVGGEKPENVALDDHVNEQTVRDFLFGSGTKLNDQQQLLFIRTAVSMNLNPLRREIYAIPRKEKDIDGNEVYKLSIVTGYETYIKRAERSGKLAGWEVWTEGKGVEMKACIRIYRKDFKSPFYHEVMFTEYNGGTYIWKTKPTTMIKKVVISQGFRLAFSEELQGLPYTADEMPEDFSQGYERPANAVLESKVEAGKHEDKPVEQKPQAHYSPSQGSKDGTPEQNRKGKPELLNLSITAEGVIPIGKFKGKKYIDLPSGYIEYLRDKVTRPEDIEHLLDDKMNMVMAHYGDELNWKMEQVDVLCKKMFKKDKWSLLNYEEKKAVNLEMDKELEERKKVAK